MRSAGGLLASADSVIRELEVETNMSYAWHFGAGHWQGWWLIPESVEMPLGTNARTKRKPQLEHHLPRTTSSYNGQLGRKSTALQVQGTSKCCNPQ
jgi:hypothetical protein